MPETGEHEPLSEGVRPLERGIQTDFTTRMSYGAYLQLDKVLHAQHLVSEPSHHDEMLFIIQHQTSELWLKLVLHELRSARELIDADQLREGLKRIARVKQVQETMTKQWSVLATLTPSEYSQFRGALGQSSGFQSYQYRAVEFALGNKNAEMLELFASEPEAYSMLAEELAAPTLYDSLLRLFARRGLPVPQNVLNRDVTKAYVENSALVPVIREIYENSSELWDLYEACEDFVDLEDNFQLWRFRHMQTVMRTIGMKRGTGGSTGVDFLQRALSLTFFPELYSVRTEIGS